MIDFRYHLVSIVAVFLALGLGLVLGSTELAPKVARGLQNTSKAEQKQIDSLLATQRQLRQELGRGQEFAQAAEHQLAGQLLAGQKVVIVAAPGAPGQIVTAIDQLLTNVAGATVTGQIELQQNLFDPSSSTQQTLTALAGELSQPGSSFDPQASPIAQIGQVLASAILTKDSTVQTAAGQHDPTITNVLNGLAGGGFLTVSNAPPTRATLAVVVIPDSPPSQNDSNRPSQELVTLAQQFELAGQGTVVAGSENGAGQGSAIDVMRSGRSGKMSSVDGADTPIGQIVVAEAMAEQLNGVSGSWGTASTAEAAGPSPAPTPSPTQPGTTTSHATPNPATTNKTNKSPARTGRS
jgi:hypothetical protein